MGRSDNHLIRTGERALMQVQRASMIFFMSEFMSCGGVPRLETYRVLGAAFHLSERQIKRIVRDFREFQDVAGVRVVPPLEALKVLAGVMTAPGRVP